MDPYNLAVCFGPTLLPIPDGKDQVQFLKSSYFAVFRFVVFKVWSCTKCIKRHQVQPFIARLRRWFSSSKKNKNRKLHKGYKTKTIMNYRFHFSGFLPQSRERVYKESHNLLRRNIPLGLARADLRKVYAMLCGRCWWCVRILILIEVLENRFVEERRGKYC